MASACSKKGHHQGLLFLMESSLATRGCSAWRGTRAGLPGDPHLPLPMPVQPSMTEGMTGNYSSAHLPSFVIHKDHTSAPLPFPSSCPLTKRKGAWVGMLHTAAAILTGQGMCPILCQQRSWHSDTGTHRTEPLAQQAAGLFRDCCNS